MISGTQGKYGILFVCSGNICRSPTAEGVLRRKLEAEGLGRYFTVDSAGTHGLHTGEPPDSRTRRAARRRGYNLDVIRARRIVAEDFHRFDLILAMDHGHYEVLERQCPAGNACDLALFMHFAPQGYDREVPDPYYGGSEGFELVLDMVEAGAGGLIENLRQRLQI